jgi:hypothetical protein
VNRERCRLSLKVGGCLNGVDGAWLDDGEKTRRRGELSASSTVKPSWAR